MQEHLYHVDYNIKRKTMENLADTLLTIIVVVMTLMIGNMHLRVRNLEKKLGR